jgi:hypothetical protein
MKRILSLILCAAATSPALAQSASDKAEQRLTGLLTPGQVRSAAPSAALPITWKASPAVEAIALPIKPYAGMPVPLAAPSRKAAKPGAVSPASPLVSIHAETTSPQPMPLPTQPLIRVPAVDAHAPLTIPILAQAHKDRASLAEPAFEVSLHAAMKQFTAVRDKPIPFMPLNLPDPFEHTRYGELRNPPSEDPMPPAVPLTMPK